jgi:hypothetical protein
MAAGRARRRDGVAEVRIALGEFMRRPIIGPLQNWHLFAAIVVLWALNRYQQSRPHKIGNPDKR